MTPTLSIVVISWNSRHYLEPCLRSIYPAVGDEIELVWVDNGSTDGAFEMVSADFPRVKALRLPDNSGVASARNVGIARSTGRYILILDDDTVATPDALHGMINYMDRHPDVGLCGVALRSISGELQQSFKDYPGLKSKIRNVIDGLLRRQRTVTLPTEVIYPCYVIGACQMIRRDLLDRVGPLDQKIFYGPEDADLCIRITRAGYKIAYLPHISIIHNWRRVTNRRLLSKMSLRHIQGLLHLYRKHHRWL